MKLNWKQKAAFGAGTVGKDMVYALPSSFVTYCCQDVLGLSAAFVGLILMIARVFDVLNDPFMGAWWRRPGPAISACRIWPARTCRTTSSSRVSASPRTGIEGRAASLAAKKFPSG